MKPTLHESPRAKVPGWLRRLMPDATGLAENPLFIRYSCQGFGMKRRLFPRWTKEFVFPWPGIGMRIGVMPFGCFAVAVLAAMILDLTWQAFETWYLGWSWSDLSKGLSAVEWARISARMKLWPYKLVEAFYDTGLILSILLGALGLWILAARLIGISGERRLAAYAQNARGAEWGEDLALARLSAGEIGEALIGAALMEELRSLRVLWGAFAGVVAIGIGAFVAYWAVHPRLGGEAAQGSVSLLAYLVMASAGALEGCGIAMLMAAARCRASARTNPPVRAAVRHALWIAWNLFACHAASLACLEGYTLIEHKIPDLWSRNPSVSQELIPGIAALGAAVLAAWLMFRRSRRVFRDYRVALGEGAIGGQK